MRLRGEMDERVDVVALQQVVHQRVVPDVAADEVHRACHPPTSSMLAQVAGIGEQVEHDQRGLAGA